MPPVPTVPSPTGAPGVDASGEPLWARLADGVRVRREPFGATVYVPRRDHFFALDKAFRSVVAAVQRDFRVVADADRARVRTLAAIGAVTTQPALPQRAFFGRSLVGEFDALPTPATPLVVNCFATARCPLRCRYCHADDLMVGYRKGDGDEDPRRVLRTAAGLSAMVAVVTGGEPLARPQQARRLIAGLAERKAVVIDTSGVGNFAGMVPTLRAHDVHVRVSLDSADRTVNDAVRPVSRREAPTGASAYTAALRTIRRAVGEGIPCSVQTVVHARNRDRDALYRLRDLLVDQQVTSWVLHVIVPAGKAAQKPAAALLCGDRVLTGLRELVRNTADDGVPLDIRVTSTHRRPNSTLLIGVDGALWVEREDGRGKTAVAGSRMFPWLRNRRLRRCLDAEGHASRYLNGTLDELPEPMGEVMPAERPAWVPDAAPSSIGALLGQLSCDERHLTARTGGVLS